MSKPKHPHDGGDVNSGGQLQDGASHQQASPHCDEQLLRATDGTELFVRRWRPRQGSARARLVVVHGYQEHGGRYRELGNRMVARGIETVAADLRGHGRSSGPRGHVGAFHLYGEDLNQVLAATATPALPTFVLGHSMGGLIALHCGAHKRLTNVAGMLVTNPYLELAMPVAKIKLLLGHALARLAPNFALGNGIDPAWLTHDPEILAGYRRDPLLLNRATAGWLAETNAAQAQLRGPVSLPMPLYFAYSDADKIASPRANAAFAERIVCADKTVELRAGELHELLQETDRLTLMDMLATWMLKRAL